MSRWSLLCLYVHPIYQGPIRNFFQSPSYFAGYILKEHFTEKVYLLPGLPQHVVIICAHIRSNCAGGGKHLNAQLTHNNGESLGIEAINLFRRHVMKCALQKRITAVGIVHASYQ